MCRSFRHRVEHHEDVGFCGEAEPDAGNDGLIVADLTFLHHSAIALLRFGLIQTQAVQEVVKFVCRVRDCLENGINNARRLSASDVDPQIGGEAVEEDLCSCGGEKARRII